MEKTILPVKSKTFWAAIVQFVIVVVSFIQGDVSLWALIMDFVAMLGVIFYRAEMGVNLRKLLNGYFQKVDWLRDGVFWTVLASVLGSVLAWLTGQIELSAMLTSVVTALVGFFLRAAHTPEDTAMGNAPGV